MQSVNHRSRKGPQFVHHRSAILSAFVLSDRSEDRPLISVSRWSVNYLVPRVYPGWRGRHPLQALRSNTLPTPPYLNEANSQVPRLNLSLVVNLFCVKICWVPPSLIGLLLLQVQYLWYADDSQRNVLLRKDSNLEYQIANCDEVMVHRCRAVNPPLLQILRIDGQWVIDDVIMQGTWCPFLQKKKTREKDVVLIVTFYLIGLLPTNHIIAYITMAYRSLWGNAQC